VCINCTKVFHCGISFIHFYTLIRLNTLLFSPSPSPTIFQQLSSGFPYVTFLHRHTCFSIANFPSLSFPLSLLPHPPNSSQLQSHVCVCVCVCVCACIHTYSCLTAAPIALPRFAKLFFCKHLGYFQLLKIIMMYTQNTVTQVTPEASAHPCLLRHYSQ
jgi:hypothetical protein